MAFALAINVFMSALEFPHFYYSFTLFTYFTLTLSKGMSKQLCGAYMPSVAKHYIDIVVSITFSLMFCLYRLCRSLEAYPTQQEKLLKGFPNNVRGIKVFLKNKIQVCVEIYLRMK